MKKTDVKLSVFTKGLATVWLYINRFSLIVPSSILIYLTFILLLNASRGFGITDESFYLLSANQPENAASGNSSSSHAESSTSGSILSGRTAKTLHLLAKLFYFFSGLR